MSSPSTTVVICFAALCRAVNHRRCHQISHGLLSRTRASQNPRRLCLCPPSSSSSQQSFAQDRTTLPPLPRRRRSTDLHRRTKAQPCSSSPSGRDTTTAAHPDPATAQSSTALPSQQGCSQFSAAVVALASTISSLPAAHRRC
ncbi:hypothetical protein M0R45_016147 [Rubus argutus]|uniref:Uncharacterized protein n=1 Tax=Rubus argutus TaxID=59490 RepID=A0AAW1XVC8_RUBAR